MPLQIDPQGFLIKPSGELVLRDAKLMGFVRGNRSNLDGASVSGISNSGNCKNTSNFGCTNTTACQGSDNDACDNFACAIYEK